MKPKILNSYKKLSIEEINQYEKEQNITFPEDYKKFLLKYNGGIPEPNNFYCDESYGFNVINKDKREE